MTASEKADKLFAQIVKDLDDWVVANIVADRLRELAWSMVLRRPEPSKFRTAPAKPQ